MMEDVAAGRRTNTVFYIPYADVLPRTYWTAGQLGVSSVYSYAAFNAFYSITDYDFGAVVQALLSDCPYEMYWFDPIIGYSTDSSIPSISGSYLVASGGIYFYLKVAAEYRGADEYTANNTYGTAVRTALQEAQSIVSGAAGKSDYEKLRTYLYAVCERNSYNIEAAEGNVDYGNPWQLIWVFDRDPDTNVVCEGYSKAYQYLCDLTAFDGNIVCYCVWGDLALDGENPGAHMWNLVRMDDGRSYLVDATNCDYDDDGVDESLFLRSCDFGSVFTGYYFYDDYGYRNDYLYDFQYDDILVGFSPDQLVVSSVPCGVSMPTLSRIPISAAYFPDAGFRSYLSYRFDWEEDGYLSPAELSDINLIDVSEESVSSLTGLKYFPYLCTLYCDGLGLETLDVTGNPRLDMLICSSNALTALDVSKNPQLLLLDCSYNNLTGLNVSGSPALLRLICSHNSLSTLDVSSNPALNYLDCADNHLSTLNLRKNRELENVFCEENELTELDLSYCDGFIDMILRYDDTEVIDGVLYYFYDYESFGGEVEIESAFDESVRLITEKQPVPGDVSRDGETDVFDAALLLQFLVGMPVDEDFDLTMAALLKGGQGDVGADAAAILLRQLP